MKKYHYIFDTFIPIYGSLFSLVVSNDLEKVKERFDGNFDDFIYAHALLRERDNYSWYAIVINPHYEHQWITHGAIAHEACHISNWVMRSKGIEWDPNNDEAQCYLNSYFVDFIYEKLSKLKMLNRVKFCKNKYVL